MNFNLPQNTESQEGTIDLLNVTFNFCSDDFVNSYYDQKLNETLDFNSWWKDNENKYLQKGAGIAKAVEDGLIADDKPETIWQFKIDKMREEKEKIVGIKNDLEQRIKQITTETANRLGKLLPNWQPKKINITFTLDPDNDFYVSGNEITIDLGRLSQEKDIIEKVTEGITHEIFHVWMNEKNKQSDTKQNEVSKSQIIFRTIDEGLAVLVSGQTLAEHHERQGRNYKVYILESFKVFKEFLTQNNHTSLEEINEQEFLNMGHFYVVGNEIVKTILQQMGIKKFRKLIDECRLTPEKIIAEYESICSKNPELISIN